LKLWVILLLNISFYCFLIFGLETKDAIYPKKIAAEINQIEANTKKTLAEVAYTDALTRKTTAEAVSIELENEKAFEELSKHTATLKEAASQSGIILGKQLDNAS